jgi:hypothetical protein
MDSLDNLMVKSLNKAFGEINPSDAEGLMDKSKTLGQMKSQIISSGEIGEDKLEGGIGNNSTLEGLAKKHKVKVEDIIDQLMMGIEVELEHTTELDLAMEIAMDHLTENPKYYTMLKKVEGKKEEAKEATGASSAGAYVGPLFGPMKKETPIKTKPKGGQVDENKGYSKFLKSDENPKGETDGLTPEVLQQIFSKIVQSIRDEENDEKPKKEETKEATTSASAGAYDVAFGAPKKDPLKLSNPKTVDKELRSVTDNNFPKLGGPGSKYVRIKDKCKKFPYCNQGDINALEFFESDMVKEAIENISLRQSLPINVIKSIVLHEFEQKFIKEDEDGMDYVTFELPDDYKPKSPEDHKKEWLESIKDNKAKYLQKELSGKEYEFNTDSLSGKVKILDVGPKGKIGGFLGVADNYDFSDTKEVSIWVEMENLKFKGKDVPVEFYEMISRYLPPEEEEDSYRGDPVEYAVMNGLDHAMDVIKYLGLYLADIRINPYVRFR